MISLILGDCVEEMRKMEENSADSIVTDPPYFLLNDNGLGFMNKEWDGIMGLWKYLWKEPLFAKIAKQFLQSVQVEQSTDEGCIALGSVNIMGSEDEKKLTAEHAVGILKSSIPQKKGFVRLLAITKADLLESLRELLPSLTKDFLSPNGESDNALYVIPNSLPKAGNKNYVVGNVTKKFKALECLEKKITFTETEAQKISVAIEVMDGGLFAREYTPEMLGLVDYAGNTAKEKRYSATILFPIDKAELTKHLTWLLFATLVTQESNKIQQSLIKSFFSVVFQEAYRVLKPGGHLLAFSGTRTYHRMASAIEDAGFEVRDMIEWVYGSGFPKSLNIGKAVDNIAELNQEVVDAKKKCGLWIKESRESLGYSINQVAELGKFYGKVNHGGSVSNWELGQLPVWDKFVKLKDILKLDSRFDYLIECRPKDYIPAEREIIGEKITGAALSGKHKGTESTFAASGTNKVSITKGTSEWEGWGTALKPAHEPICMARKPLSEKTVAENCLKWGTGGINIDESRVPSEPTPINKLEKWSGFGQEKRPEYVQHMNTSGRFPANLIHDNSEEVKECFPETGNNWRKDKGNFGGFVGNGKQTITNGQDDSGNASRFFKSIIYQAKASKSERNKGCDELDDKLGGSLDGGNDKRNGDKPQLKLTKNNHPTVKPIALMEYLIKMVTKEGGIVLDPFMGSGSTGVAAKQNGYSFIGIEKEPEYMQIAESRISAITPLHILPSKNTIDL